MEKENIYTHIEDTMSNIYLNGNMLNSGTVMVMLEEKDKQIKELEEQIQGMVCDQIDLLAQANKELALYKKAFEIAKEDGLNMEDYFKEAKEQINENRNKI